MSVRGQLHDATGICHSALQCASGVWGRPRSKNGKQQTWSQVWEQTRQRRGPESLLTSAFTAQNMSLLYTRSEDSGTKSFLLHMNITNERVFLQSLPLIISLLGLLRLEFKIERVLKVTVSFVRE